MTPKRPRKPATILRHFRRVVTRFYPPGSNRMLALEFIAELRRAIATSGKAPGRP